MTIPGQRSGGRNQAMKSTAAEVADVLRQLAAEGLTMLMATHDLRLAASVSREAAL